MATYSEAEMGFESGQPGYSRQADAERTISGGSSGMDFKQIKSTVADKLHGAAQRLQERAERGEGTPELGRWSQRAGEWMDRSADYIHDLEPQQLRTDIENQVRRNPGRSLLIAGAAGLLLGRLLRGR